MGGQLTTTEIGIIGGALELTNKTALQRMVPLDKASFSAQLHCHRMNARAEALGLLHMRMAGLAFNVVAFLCIMMQVKGMHWQGSVQDAE